MSDMFTFAEELQRKLNNATAGIDFSYSTKALTALSNSMTKAVANVDLSHTTKALLDSIRPLAVDNQLYYSNMINISASTSRVLESIAYKQEFMKNATNIQNTIAEIVKSVNMSSYSDVFSQVAKQFRKLDIYGDYEIDEEQQIEFEADLIEIDRDDGERNWQQRAYEVILKWSDKNPLFAYFVERIVWLFLAAFLSLLPLFQIKSTQATMRDYPSVNAEIVISVEHKQIVSVIDSQKNWIKVVFFNPVDGNLYEGWLSKRSCEPIEIEESEEHEQILDIDNELKSEDNIEDNENVEEQ